MSEKSSKLLFLCARSPSFIPGDGTLIRPDVFWLQVMGRLKPGWSLQQASAQLDAVSRGIFEATVPDGYSNTELDTYPKFQIDGLSGQKRDERAWRDL